MEDWVPSDHGMTSVMATQKQPNGWQDSDIAKASISGILGPLGSFLVNIPRKCISNH
jgi:hypothetical protein